MEDVALPDDEQTRNFAEHVAGAHSWYKHLPPLPPGRRFAFYLDRDAGRERETLQNGRFRLHRSHGRHAVQVSLHVDDDRRVSQKFGYWNYAVGGPSAVMSTQPTTPEEWGRWYHLDAKWPLLLHTGRLGAVAATDHGRLDLFRHQLDSRRGGLALVWSQSPPSTWPSTTRGARSGPTIPTSSDINHLPTGSRRLTAAIGRPRTGRRWTAKRETFWETERPLMRQRIFDTMLAARRRPSGSSPATPDPSGARSKDGCRTRFG
jgi:hypothetical protein